MLEQKNLVSANESVTPAARYRLCAPTLDLYHRYCLSFHQCVGGTRLLAQWFLGLEAPVSVFHGLSRGC